PRSFSAYLAAGCGDLSIDLDFLRALQLRSEIGNSMPRNLIMSLAIDQLLNLTVENNPVDAGRFTAHGGSIADDALVNSTGLAIHVVHEQILPKCVRRGEIRFAAAEFCHLLNELHQPI